MTSLFETYLSFVETCEDGILHTLPGVTRRDIEEMLVKATDQHPDRVWKVRQGFLVKFDDGEVRSIYFVEGSDEFAVYDVLD